MREQLDHFGIAAHLDSVTFSAEIGWRKPSPRIFEAALGALGERADTTVMIGDSVDDDIAGARAAGLLAVRVCREPHECVAAPAGGGFAPVRELPRLATPPFGAR